MTTHSAAPAPAGPAASTVVLASAAVLALMTAINVVAEIPEQLAGAIAGLPVAAVPVYFEARARRKTTREQSLQAIAGMEGVGLRQTLSVVIVVGALLLVFDTLIGAAVVAAYGAGVWVVSMPVLAALSVAIGVQASHHLPHRAAPWLALAVVVMVSARLAIMWGMSATLRRAGVRIDYVAILPKLVVVVVLLFIALWLGSVWGRRNREAVLLSRNFKRLKADDRRAALDMVRAAAQQELTGGPPGPGQSRSAAR